MLFCSGRSEEEALELAVKKFNLPKEKIILKQGGWEKGGATGGWGEGEEPQVGGVMGEPHFTAHSPDR